VLSYRKPHASDQTLPLRRAIASSATFPFMFRSAGNERMFDPRQGFAFKQPKPKDQRRKRKSFGEGAARRRGRRVRPRRFVGIQVVGRVCLCFVADLEVRSSSIERESSSRQEVGTAGRVIDEVSAAPRRALRPRCSWRRGAPPPRPRRRPAGRNPRAGPPAISMRTLPGRLTGLHNGYLGPGIDGAIAHCRAGDRLDPRSPPPSPRPLCAPAPADLTSTPSRSASSGPRGLTASLRLAVPRAAPRHCRGRLLRSAGVWASRAAGEGEDNTARSDTINES